LEFVRIHFQQLTEPIVTSLPDVARVPSIFVAVDVAGASPRFLPATSPRACGDPNR